MIQKEMKTLVCWDINSCPIPPDYDPSLVSVRIVSALKNAWISGSVTITAIGKLSQAPSMDVLQKLSSTGIALTHSGDVYSYVDEWASNNRAPANIMLICGPGEVEDLARLIYDLSTRGYTILLAYSQRDTVPAVLWESFLLDIRDEWLWKSLLEADDLDSGSADNKQETTSLVLEESPFSCSLCDFTGQNFEAFTTHLESKKHKVMHGDEPIPELGDTVNALQLKGEGYNKEEYCKREEEFKKKIKTLVCWDINSCPIPPDYDPSLVSVKIVSALKNAWISGSVTITAIGKLSQAPSIDVLQKLSSTGIALTHSEDVYSYVDEWVSNNRAPANIMLICGPGEVEDLARLIYDLSTRGYTILLAYSQRDTVPAFLWESFLLDIRDEWLWKSLLESDDMDSGSADNKQETTSLVLEESSFSCSLCDFTGQNFEAFTTHLESKKHIVMDVPELNPKEVNKSKKRTVDGQSKK